MVQYTLVNEIFKNFPGLSIIGEYVKIKVKKTQSPNYFLSSRGQKIKNITNIQQKFFLLTFLILFFMAFLILRVILTINI